MGKTKIEWADFVFNPWWGCQRVSPGCENCYAETQAKRYGHQVWGPAKTTGRRFFGVQHWTEPLKWDREARVAGERRRVFCASMADVFEDNHLVNDWRKRLFGLIQGTPSLDWLLLTKRPENLARMLPDEWLHNPQPNVWLGTSVEDQQRADERLPLLLQTPAVVRFLSCEPLLGPVDLHKPWPPTAPLPDSGGVYAPWMVQQLDWVIAGGESGSKARPMHPDWARSLRDQCQAAGVAFHFKQWGGRTHAAGGRLLDGRTWDEFPTSVGGRTHA